MSTFTELAEKNITKQIKQVAEAKADDETKALISNGLAGIRRLLQTVDQISDPKNPPADDSAWAGVVQLVKGAVGEDGVTPGVYVVRHPPQHLVLVLDVYVLVHNHDYLAEHHLPHTPDGTHHLPGVEGVLLVYRYEDAVVEYAEHGHVEVDYLRDGQFE